MGIIQKIKEGLFEKYGFKSVIRIQIDLYKKFQKDFPNEEKNDILNILLRSRIKSASKLPQFPVDEQENFYKEFFEKSYKTIADVIFVIVMYEYVYSRKTWVQKNSSLEGIILFRQTVVDSIIEELTRNRIQTNFSTPPSLLFPPTLIW